MSIEWVALVRIVSCSFRIATALQSGGAIPANTSRLLVFVGFVVIIQQVSFSVASSCFAYMGGAFPPANHFFLTMLRQHS